MTVPRVTRIGLTLAFTLALPSLVAAQRGGAIGGDARTLFTWTGTVDREVILTLDGNRLYVEGDERYRDARSRRRDDGAVRARNALPRTRGLVQVQRLDGRGSVSVIEHPSARNGYVTRILLRDPRGGADRYRVRAVWQPLRAVAGGRDGRDGRDGRGNVVLVGRDAVRGGVPGGAGRRVLDEGVVWSGVVDDVVDLHIRGRQVAVLVRSGAPTYAVRSRFIGNGLGRRELPMQLVRAEGRGNVAVIQQPAPWNGFTGIVRVVDRRGGPGRYALDIRW